MSWCFGTSLLSMAPYDTLPLKGKQNVPAFLWFKNNSFIIGFSCRIPYAQTAVRKLRQWTAF